MLTNIRNKLLLPNKCLRLRSHLAAGTEPCRAREGPGQGAKENNGWQDIYAALRQHRRHGAGHRPQTMVLDS